MNSKTVRPRSVFSRLAKLQAFRKSRFFHFATVFGLTPWRALSTEIEAFDRRIAARTACVVAALPRSSWPIVPPCREGTILHHHTPGLATGASELERPPAHAPIRDVDTPPGRQILGIATGGCEAEMEPDGLLDDLGWKAMAGAGDSAHADRHLATLASATPLT
jgi:hypothetical protein